MKERKSSKPRFLIPVWINEICSEHEYFREKYLRKITKLIGEEIDNVDGIMIYGLNHTELTLVQKFKNLKNVTQIL